MDATFSKLPADPKTLRALLLREREESLRQRDELQQRDILLHERQTAIGLQQAQVAELQQTLGQLQRLNEGLQHRLDLALRRIYGRSSEKIDAQQLLLFGQLLQQAAQALAGQDQAAAAKDEAAKPQRKGHGRRPLPADLPRQRIEYPLPPEELTCPCCNQPRVRIGEEISEQLDYVPASLFVIEHVRPKLACPRCQEGVVTAERPEQGQVIAKGLPGPGLAAHLVVSKYADHQPLYRQEGILERHGVFIPRSTTCGWMKASAQLLWPLVLLMASRIRGSKVIHTDDTPVPVMDRQLQGQTKTGRMWVYLGDPNHPYVVYDYTPTRSRDGPAAWLKNFQGYLQADAFGGYDGIYLASGGAIVEVACWAHARRKFYDARGSDGVRAHHALAVIRLLYEVERQAKGKQAQERRTLRQERALPLLEELHQWLLGEQPRVLPKSPMGTAIGYALNNWKALGRYAGDGDLAIDNNAAERAIRPLCLGRKNYLFYGSDAGGKTAATLYSVLESGKRHGLNPFTYLRDVLARIGSTPMSQLEQFLPDRWLAQDVAKLAHGQ